MKFSKFAILGAACALLASCSNEMPVENASNNKTNGGYAAFAINLPTVNGTGSRAVVDAQGDAQEYAVSNGRVLVFLKNADESKSTFVCSSALSGMNWSAGAAGEITTSSKSVARLEDIDLNNDAAQYGAIVVLNYNDDFKFPTAGQTLGAWTNTVQNSSMTLVNGSGTYITMSSAPKYVSGKEPVILADIDKEQIYQTESQASASATPACEAFVQRNLAKVSLSIDAAWTGTINGGFYDKDVVTITAWGLDITNKTSYGVQVTDGLSTSYADIWKGGDKLNRFFGNGTKFQRVFWAKDPNYDKDIKTAAEISANFNTLSDVTENPTCLYARENTFDVNHQMQGQTTRVVIKANYTPNGFTSGETFYKLGSDTKLWHEADLKNEIKSRTIGVIGSASVSVDLGNVTTAGMHSLSEVTIKNGDTKLATEEYDNVAVAMGLANASEKNISSYVDGKTYYVARVKHFGDSDTPWKIGDPTYGGKNYEYLGRYGMVRNNWYDVNITKISKPGSPVVPEIVPETPDDENEYYISVSVNILSWAKRVHDTVL